MSEYSPDRVQGMLGAAERWQKVSPKAVVSGSTAQAENVLTDAIHDIACLWRVANEAATEIASLRRELAELREDKRIVDELLDAAITDYNEARQEALEEAAQAASPNSGNGIFSSYEHGRRDAAAAIRNLAGEKADG